MRTLQEIFNAVLDFDDYYSVRKLMCCALQHAESKGIVTEEEYCFAIVEIRDYLRPTDSAYLRRALTISGLSSTIEARTAIYRDWANRPKLIEKSVCRDLEPSNKSSHF